MFFLLNLNIFDFGLVKFILNFFGRVSDMIFLKFSHEICSFLFWWYYFTPEFSQRNFLEKNKIFY